MKRTQQRGGEESLEGDFLINGFSKTSWRTSRTEMGLQEKRDLQKGQDKGRGWLFISPRGFRRCVKSQSNRLLVNNAAKADMQQHQPPLVNYGHIVRVSL